MVTLLNYWQEISLTAGAVATFFIGRKSTKIAERKNNADAVTAMQTTYDVFLKHYKDQYDQLLIRLTNLELRNAVLLESSEEWQYKFRELEKNHARLKLEFDDYKKTHGNENN